MVRHAIHTTHTHTLTHTPRTCPGRAAAVMPCHTPCHTMPCLIWDVPRPSAGREGGHGICRRDRHQAGTIRQPPETVAAVPEVRPIRSKRSPAEVQAGFHRRRPAHHRTNCSPVSTHRRRRLSAGNAPGKAGRPAAGGGGGGAPRFCMHACFLLTQEGGLCVRSVCSLQLAASFWVRGATPV